MRARLGANRSPSPITRGNKNNSMTGVETQELQGQEGGFLVLLVLTQH